ncbi:transposase [Streptomyces sp. NBC_01304]|uniref:transposase n=1 Tax=Streptomyces sp. NBC_01304 TaxID=2903818 RepID=UPI002E10D18F|nr:transposase [Streptomyces sp. NBC_01304]
MRPCPDRTSCTTGSSGRTVNFLPQSLHELQVRNRTDQQDPVSRRLYASRSGVEGTVSEFVNGHRMRRCRYLGLAKTQCREV